MATIRIDFTTDGAAAALKQAKELRKTLEQLNRLNQGGNRGGGLGDIGNAAGAGSQGTKQLVDTLKLLSKILDENAIAAQNFADSIGLSADETVAALAVIDELNRGNVSAADQYKFLSDQLGVTRTQFQRLSEVAQQSQGRIQAALGGGVAAQVGGLNNRFSLLLKTFLAFGAAVAVFKTVDAALKNTGRTWADVGKAIGLSKDQLDLFFFDFQLGITKGQTVAQNFVRTLQNFGKSAKTAAGDAARVGRAAAFGGEKGVGGFLNLVERLSLGLGAFGLARQAMAALGGETKKTTKELKGFNSILAGFAAGASFAIINAISNAFSNAARSVVDFGKGILTVGGDAQKANISFTTILGSAELAQQTLAELSDFAAKTPFDLPGVVDAGRQLLAFGFEQDELISQLTRLGDVSAGVNIPFGELAEIYGKARVQGRLFQEDINQLTGRGIPVIQELAKQFGVSESEVRKLVETGQVGFENLEQAFISLTSEGGKFGGLMAAQAATIPGQISNISDSFVRLQTSLFNALAPAVAGGLQLFGDTLAAAGDDAQALDIIAEAGERLAASLAANPQLAQQLGAAFRDISEVLASGLAAGLDGFANFLDDNPGQIAEYIESLQALAEAALGIVGAFTQLVAAAGGSAIDAFSDLTPVLQVAANVLEFLVGAIQTLGVETGLLNVVLKVLVLRFLALQAVALGGVIAGVAGSFATLVTVTRLATAALGAFNVNIAAAIPPLAVLAAAIAATQFIKLTRDLKVANQELEAYISGLNVATDQGFDFANKLSNLNKAITAAGGQATEEQKRQLTEYTRLAKEQVEELTRQLGEVQSLEPVNDSQRAAQQNLIASVQTTIKALEGQITAAEETGGKISQGVGDGLKKKQPSLEEALKGLATANDLALKKIEVDTAKASANIITAGGAQSEVAKVELAALNERLTNNEAFLAELQGLQSSALTTEETEKLGAEILEVEAQIASDRIQIVEDGKDAAEEVENERVEALKKSIAAAESVVKTENAARERSLLQLERSLLASGETETAIAERVAAEKLQADQDSINARIALERQRIATFGEGSDEAKDAIVEIAGLENELLQTQIDGERQIRDLAQARLDEQIELEERRQQIIVDTLDFQDDSLRRQGEFLEQQAQLSQAAAGLQDTVLTGQIAKQQTALDLLRQQQQIDEERAEITTDPDADPLEQAQKLAELDEQRLSVRRQLNALGIGQGASERAIEAEILALQQERFAQEFANLQQKQEADTLALEIQIEQNRLANERAIIEAQIAQARLQAELAIAQAQGNTNLVNALGQAVGLQDQLLGKLREQQSLEEQSAQTLRDTLALQQGSETVGFLNDFANEARTLAGDITDPALARQAAQFARGVQTIADGAATAAGDAALTASGEAAVQIDGAADTLAASGVTAGRAIVDAARTAGEILSRINLGGGGAVPAFRTGGVAPGGPVLVHKDEFMIPPRGTQIVSQRESRALIRESLAPVNAVAAQGNDHRLLRAVTKLERAIRSMPAPQLNQQNYFPVDNGDWRAESNRNALDMWAILRGI